MNVTMSFKDNVINKKNQFHEFLLNPKVVKNCIIIALIVFIPSIIIGLIVAQLDPSGLWKFWMDNPSLWIQYGMGESDNAGYSIFTDYISNLGSLNYTLIPKFLDDAMMITSIVMVPVIFYLKKLLDATIQERAESKKKLGKILSNLALITYLIGLVSFFGVGFFSEDVADFLQIATNGGASIAGYDLHDIFTVLVFGFLALSGVFIGIIFLVYSSLSFDIFKVKIPKSVIIISALEMIFLPISLSIVFLTYWWPFIEWMAMLSLFGWIIPLALLTLKRIRIDLASERKKIKVKDIRDFLTNPKLVKRCIYLIIAIFPTSILIGFLVAQFDPAGPGADLAGYNIIENFISDMGSLRYTPVPKFLDDSCMITAFLMIPCMLYIKKVVDSAEKEPGAKFRKFLGNIAFITMLIGIIGLWGLGFFSEDVSMALESTVWPGFYSHSFFAFYLFPFIAIGGFFIGLVFFSNYSLILELFKLKIPKIVLILLGFVMMVLTPIFSAIFLINWQITIIVPPSAPFWEWMFLFSVLIWLFAISLFSLNKIRYDLGLK